MKQKEMVFTLVMKRLVPADVLRTGAPVRADLCRQLVCAERARMVEDLEADGWTVAQCQGVIDLGQGLKVSAF